MSLSGAVEDILCASVCMAHLISPLRPKCYPAKRRDEFEKRLVVEVAVELLLKVPHVMHVIVCSLL